MLKKKSTAEEGKCTGQRQMAVQWRILLEDPSGGDSANVLQTFAKRFRSLSLARLSSSTASLSFSLSSDQVDLKTTTTTNTITITFWSLLLDLLHPLPYHHHQL